jgi:hypothetical protein
MAIHFNHTILSAHDSKASQRDAFAQLLAMHRQESAAIASLSTKLRLTNSSFRRDERYNDRKRVTTPSGRPPWERPS